MNFRLTSTVILCVFFGCKNNSKEIVIAKESEQIVVISKSAPQNYKHFIGQDSIGATVIDTIGAYAYVDSPIFEYYDSQNNINSWQPKTNEIDTLVIPYYKEYLELSSRNSFAALSHTFLVKNGDTIIFTYQDKIPHLEFANRQTNDLEANYNFYRLKTLFKNKYTSHYKVYFGILLDKSHDFDATTVKYYQSALQDNQRELDLLDSLFKVKAISDTDYKYRITALNSLMDNHRTNNTIQKWQNINQGFNTEKVIPANLSFDLSQTDSLMKFQFFREHLNRISQYDLNYISENNMGSGSSYIDSRIRFDSIVADGRFTQAAKNFLLFDAYKGISMDFKVKDKEEYFKKLLQNTTNRNQLEKLRKEHNLDFNFTKTLQLSTIENKKITYSELLHKNKGKWLYIDFWASWCAPCRQQMPASRKLKTELKNKPVEFIYLGLNDKKENWKAAIIKDSIGNAQHYFIENGNTSKVVEDLGIESIPHYLIYSPEGKLINGYAKRPGKGAKEQLELLIAD